MQDFLNLYKMYIPYSLKPYSFIIIGTTLATDNKEYKERIQKLVMTTEGKIRDEKLKYNINREAAKISTSDKKLINMNSYW